MPLWGQFWRPACLERSAPTADDPEDHITDNALGEQFIEIAKRLKKRYGAGLVDLVPTRKAENLLMDIWGWV